ncbi:hypothetical protein BDL97_08G049800 [Sphagnum fallax]|nr:hypothetical protein BDL97_08G049800 [Sphagnum fallax]
MGGEQRSRSEEKRIQVCVRCASPSARVGLIKKASELSILCGTHVGIIVFSEARKAFSFGHPCVDYVIEKTLLMRECSDDDNDDDDEEEEEESKKKGDSGGGTGSSRKQRKNRDMIAEQKSVAVSSGIHELQYVQQRIDALYQLLVRRASCLQHQQQQIAAVVNSTPILFNEDHDQSQFLHLELAPDPSCSTLTTNAAARQQIYDLQQQQ